MNFAFKMMNFASKKATEEEIEAMVNEVCMYCIVLMQKKRGVSYYPEVPACFMHKSPCSMHKSPCFMHKSPCFMHKSPCSMHKSPYSMHKSPYSMHKSPYSMHKSPFYCRVLQPLQRFYAEIFLILYRVLIFLVVKTMNPMVMNEPESGG